METRFIYKKTKETIFFNIQLQKRIYKSTGIKLQPKEWAKGFPKKINSTAEIRTQLTTWKNEIDQYIKDFILTANRQPTANEMTTYIDYLIKGKKQANNETIQQLIELFKDEQKDELHSNTIRYKNIHLDHFAKAIKASKLTTTDLTDEVISLYRSNLIKEGKRNERQNTTTNNYVKTVKSFLNWLYKRKYTTVNFADQLERLKEVKKDVIALTDSEIEILERASLQPHLQRQIDLFLIGCCTALSISDLKRISSEMIQGEFLIIRRQKTGTPLHIPLIPEAIKLLKKYDYNLGTIAIADNKGNENLKAAFKQLGLNRNVNKTTQIGKSITDEVTPLYSVISWHKARKTAITTAIKKGIPLQLVMQLSGHSKYETMKKYIDLATNELANEMNAKMSKNNHLQAVKKAV